MFPSPTLTLSQTDVMNTSERHVRVKCTILRSWFWWPFSDGRWFPHKTIPLFDNHWPQNFFFYHRHICAWSDHSDCLILAFWCQTSIFCHWDHAISSSFRPVFVKYSHQTAHSCSLSQSRNVTSWSNYLLDYSLWEQWHFMFPTMFYCETWRNASWCFRSEPSYQCFC